MIFTLFGCGGLALYWPPVIFSMSTKGWGYISVHFIQLKFDDLYLFGRADVTLVFANKIGREGVHFLIFVVYFGTFRPAQN